MQAHPIRRQAIRRRGLAEARSAEAVAPERGVRGTYKLSPERRAKGGLGCPVSHPEHGDTLNEEKFPMMTDLREHFSTLEDPRIDRNKRHELLDIVLVVICGMLSGADGWEAIEEFGKEKLTWLRQFGSFANGVPSHDCIARVISRLSVKGFSRMLSELDRGGH